MISLAQSEEGGGGLPVELWKVQVKTEMEWQAFVGKATGRNETTGHNFHLTVTQRRD